MNPAFGVIGLARKGGLLTMGEEATGAACRAGQAAAVFTASDISENSLRRAAHYASVAGVEHFLLSPSKAELGEICGRESLAMFAVLDVGMALTIAKRFSSDEEKLERLQEAVNAARARKKKR